ncbi:hypothetical protein F5884DRAFT_895828 [Xylogone sp. PMI_703]|nr:hypothetical protein F5884DRAFT_895828 [Xylogone sp. PMI_703]
MLTSAARARVGSVLWVLGYLGAAVADLEYHFTMSVTSPAPVPGQPFKLTWTGGEPTEVVYIVLNGYFPDSVSQNIIYTRTDILSNAPNNGSWTYYVPVDISGGRHSFSIGYNPLQLSDTTDIFVIDSTFVPPPPASSTNVPPPTYQGCGLPPLPDYTYTGYQPPCTVTMSGRVETIYPIVPASLSSIFYGSAPQAPPTPPTPIPTPTINTAFATGVYAQALQCSNPVTPSQTGITVGGATTIFSLVACNTAPTTSAPPPNRDGVCHESGYSTFSVSGTSSVCCPNGWATTPLNSELFCFTSTESPDVRRADLIGRQVSTETLVAGAKSKLVEIFGLVFTTAGVVTKGIAIPTKAPSTLDPTSAPGGSTSTAVRTVSPASSTIQRNSAVKPRVSVHEITGIAVFVGLLHYSVL